MNAEIVRTQKETEGRRKELLAISGTLFMMSAEFLSIFVSLLFSIFLCTVIFGTYMYLWLEDILEDQKICLHHLAIPMVGTDTVRLVLPSFHLLSAAS